MSNKELRDLYGMVGRRVSAPTGISDAYQMIYEESEVEGEMITIFYAQDQDREKAPGYAQLSALEKSSEGAIAKRVMSIDYFNTNVVGRLDEAMSRSVKALVLTAMGGKGDLDPVAYRGIYDVFAYYAIPGEDVNSLIKWRDDTANDMFLTAVRNLASPSGTLSIIELLQNNLEGKFNTERVVEFLNSLWDVKDVQGRTSVGRGELAMCCFSRCHKGEPGDVVETRLTRGSAGRLEADNDDTLKIEVKGKGGRPGKEGYSRKGFSPAIVKLLENVETKTDATQGSFDQMQMASADRAVFSVFNTSIESHIKEVLAYYSNVDQLGDGQDDLEGHLRRNLQPTPTDVGNTVDDDWTLWIQSWLVANSAGKSKARIRGILGLEHISRQASLPNMYGKQDELLSDSSTLVNEKMLFKDAVETFFLQVLPMIPENGITNQQIATAIWLTRTESHDKAPGINDAAISAITGMLDSDEIAINDMTDVKRLVGCAQVTSYCAADDFSHLMCVDDDHGDMQKMALIVHCVPRDPGETFRRLWTAFNEHGVEVMLSIDDQNKGCQIKFSSGQAG